MLPLKSIITASSITFKAFNYDVMMSKNKSNLWHFSAVSPAGGKKYIIYCTPEFQKVRRLIQIALKKCPGDSKLVVISGDHSKTDWLEAQAEGFALIDLKTLKEYGTAVIEAKQREGINQIPRAA